MKRNMKLAIVCVILCITLFEKSPVAAVEDGSVAAVEDMSEVMCADPLGVRNKRKIKNGQMRSSSFLDRKHKAKSARLDSRGGWSAKHNRTGQWISVNFIDVKAMTGIKIQGRTDAEEWVSEFKVQYRTTGRWQSVKDDSEEVMAFTGNSDQNTAVTRMFASRVKASNIRIQPTKWHNGIGMRFEVLGCKVCSEDEWQCGIHSKIDKCIKLYHVCNAIDECGDGSDEDLEMCSVPRSCEFCAGPLNTHNIYFNYNTRKCLRNTFFRSTLLRNFTRLSGGTSGTLISFSDPVCSWCESPLVQHLHIFDFKGNLIEKEEPPEADPDWGSYLTETKKVIKTCYGQNRRRNWGFVSAPLAEPLKDKF